MIINLDYTQKGNAALHSLHFLFTELSKLSFVHVKYFSDMIVMIWQ